METQHHLRSAVLAASVSVSLCAGAPLARAQSAIDALIQQGEGPADISPGHAYSDYSDPLGRFMDSLAAGAYADAKSLQPDACKSWSASRQTTAVSGKFWVRGTLIDIEALCADRR